MMYMIKEMAILQEAKNVEVISSHKVRFKAKLQRLNEFSYNGKKYLKEPMMIAIQKKKQLLSINGFVGEMDHPIQPSMARLLNVLYQNTSHVFKEIWTEGDNVWAILENTSNEKGRDLFAFIVHDKIPVGFSLRALGDLQNTREGQVVHKNIDVVTWDCVSVPSFSSCTLTEIMNHKHLESYRATNELANLEEYVYGDSTQRSQMLLESKVTSPIFKVVSHLENRYLFDSCDVKFKAIRNMLKAETIRKIKTYL